MGRYMRVNSWVIKNIDTGAVVTEIFNEKVLKEVNTKKYMAVPIQEHLASINADIKAGRFY